MEPFVQKISPPSRFSLNTRELWQYRELFYFFTWRDIKVKYKQTYLGILWAILQPLGMMVIFTFLFSKTWPINTGPVRYPVFVLAGLIAWNLFSNAVSHAGESMITNAKIINKIYFPRLVIPASAVLAALFDFLMAFIVFIIICFAYKQPVHWSAIIWWPAGILVLFISAMGAGSLLSALNLKYRDFRYTIPFLLQVLFFASQVIYPLQSIQQSWLKYVLAANPVNLAIEFFRQPFTPVGFDMTIVLTGIAATFILFITGIYYFRKTESFFADLA